jgi:hypothetical protein
MSGFTVARVCLFFKLEYHGVSHSYALIHDYTTCGEEPDDDTGMCITWNSMTTGLSHLYIQYSVCSTSYSSLFWSGTHSR